MSRSPYWHLAIVCTSKLGKKPLRSRGGSRKSKGMADEGLGSSNHAATATRTGQRNVAKNQSTCVCHDFTPTTTGYQKQIPQQNNKKNNDNMLVFLGCLSAIPCAHAQVCGSLSDHCGLIGNHDRNLHISVHAADHLCHQHVLQWLLRLVHFSSRVFQAPLRVQPSWMLLERQQAEGAFAAPARRACRVAAWPGAWWRQGGSRCCGLRWSRRWPCGWWRLGLACLWWLAPPNRVAEEMSGQRACSALPRRRLRPRGRLLIG